MTYVRDGKGSLLEVSDFYSSICDLELKLFKKMKFTLIHLRILHNIDEM